MTGTDTTNCSLYKQICITCWFHRFSLPYYVPLPQTLHDWCECSTGTTACQTMVHIPTPHTKPCLGWAASEQIPWCCLTQDMESLHIGDYTHGQGQQHLIGRWGYYTLVITRTGTVNNTSFGQGVVTYCLGHGVTTHWGLHILVGSTTLA